MADTAGGALAVHTGRRSDRRLGSSRRAAHPSDKRFGRPNTRSYTGDLQLFPTGRSLIGWIVERHEAEGAGWQRESQTRAQLGFFLPRGQTVPDRLSYSSGHKIVGAAPRGQPGWHSSQLHCLSGTRRLTPEGMWIRARSDGGLTGFDKSLLSVRLATSAYGVLTKQDIGYPRRRLPSPPGAAMPPPHRSWTRLSHPSLCRRRYHPWVVAHTLHCHSVRLRKGWGPCYTTQGRQRESRPNPDKR